MATPLAPLPDERPAPGDRAARYALGVLMLVYVFNFIDRQILSILAERIKADLALTDAQMGYLYGTAFAVFYAVFGIPLGRLADVWDRRRLIAIGLASWSVLTTLSGLAHNFAQLALARVGVGVGESSANPAAYSLLSDLFPPARRATVLAVYSSAIYIGTGVSLGIGGLIVNRWDAAWGAAPPLGLHGWQVAFFVVGLPGVLLALWVNTLHEPVRGQMDGIVSATRQDPLRVLADELGAVLPPFAALRLARADGLPALLVNLAGAAWLAACGWALTAWLGNPVQWISLGLGLYVTLSWAQLLRHRDRPTYALVVRSPALVWSSLCFALLSFTGYSYTFWMAPYLIRTLGADVRQTGLVLGGISASCGWLGVTLGGLVADRLRRSFPAGRMYVAMFTAVTPIPVAIALLSTSRLSVAFALNVPLFFCTATWLGPGAATVQDLVLPRMRAAASAAMLLVVTFIGLALGPYTVGRLSMATGSLRAALLWALIANGLALVCAVMAADHLAHDESTRLSRARAAGEPV
jgi:MFS family permease